MKKRNTIWRHWAIRTVALCQALFLVAFAAQAQYTTVAGSTTNTAGNSLIPSTGNGNCGVAPQVTPGTGTRFNLTSAVAGTLGTDVKVKTVTLNLTHTFNADLLIYLVAPNGGVFELSTRNGGGGDNMNITFCDDRAAANFPAITTAGTTTIAGTFNPEGSLAAITCGTLPAPTVSPNLAAFTGPAAGTWQLVIYDEFFGDAGTLLSWGITFGPLSDAACSTIGGLADGSVLPAFAQQLCVGTSTASFTLPSTPNCAGTTFTYQIGTAAPITATPGSTVNLTGLTVPGSVVLTYRTEPCVAIATQTLSFTSGDVTPPSIVCPAPVTINLAPGACDALVNLAAPTVTDNCPLTGFNTLAAEGFATQPAGWTTSSSNPNPVPAGVFNFGINTTPTGAAAPATFVGPYVTIDDDNAGTGYNPAVFFITSPVYNLSGYSGVVLSFNYFNQDFIGSGDMLAQVSGDGGTTWTNIPGFPLAGTTNGTVSFNVPAASLANFRFRFGYDDQGAWAWGCGIDNFLIQGNLNAGQVSNDFNAQIGAISDVFPQGTTTIIYSTTDAAGNPATCSTTVTVNEFVPASGVLACNDLVQISLDEDCTLAINADQVLEGGPYGCYDDYIVQLDRIAPYGNGPWTPGVLTSSDIGKTYGVRVIDDANENGFYDSNENTCWGEITVEDKLKPVLQCVDASIPCNQTSVPTYTSPLLSGLQYSASATGLPVSLIDFQTREFTFTVGNDGTLEDVDFLVNVSGPVWFGNIDIEIESPAGTVVTAWNNVGGCAGPIWVRFDDEGTTALACASFTTGTNAAIPFNLGLLSDFDGENIAGDWTIRITDIDAFGDVSTISDVQLFLTYSGQFSTGFPNGLTAPGDFISINDATKTYVVAAGAGTPQLDNCSNVTLTYLDTETEATCEGEFSSTISRKWTATDASGNTSTCIQLINRIRPTLNDVVLAPDYDGIDNPAFTCGQVASMPIVDGKHIPTPQWIELQGLQGYPYVFGLPDGCNINWDYDDLVIDVCDGTYKIRRKWTIIDWCTGVDFEYNQLLKVVDEDGPVLPDVNPAVVGNQLANITVSTDPSACCATVNLPDVIVSDACSRINNVSAMITTFDQYTGEQSAMYELAGSLTTFPGNNLWNPDTLAVFGNTACLPLSPNPGVTNSGGHLVTYTVEDDCGNTSTGTFRIVVRDFTVPEVACVEFTVVSVGADDPYDCYTGYEPDYSYPSGQPAGTPVAGSCQGGGVTWVKATSFDNGSYDNCGNLRFTVRRDLTNASACINNLNGLNGSIPCDNPFGSFPTEYERATGTGTMSSIDNQGIALVGADSLKFYCCEVNGDPITVILAVYQVDADGNVQFGPDGQPIRNECMVQVEVQDKVKPICQSPANVTVACENFDPSLWAYGQAIPSDNCCLDTTKNYQGQCGLTHSVSYASFDTVCNRGTIVRTFRAFDCHGLSSQCTQRIVVNYGQYYFVKFPDDRTVGNCTPGGDYGKPTFYGEDCELLATSFVDEVFTVNDGACFKIERTWTVINWCTYNQNNPCIFVPNPNPLGPQANQQQFTGPTVSAPNNGIPGWTASVFTLDPGTTPWNYGTQTWAANANCYKYKQIIKVYDNNAPVVTADPYTCDPTKGTTNDPQLWNSMFWYEAATNSHDMCEEPTDLTLSATDLCAGANLNVSYLLFLDLDNSGDMETVVNSLNPLASGQLLPGEVLFGNAGSPNFLSGQPQRFDFRLVPNTTQELAVQDRWVFSTYLATSGANRTAKVVFRRGNQAAADANSPTVQLPYGTHKIKWIVEDGCGNQTVKEVTFTVGDCKKPTVVCKNGLSVNIMQTGMVTLWASDFLLYGEDNCTPAGLLKYGIRKSGTGSGFPTETNVTFDCTELGTQFVELWAQDKAGNADFCETYILVQDNMGACGTNATIAGALKTEATQGVENATVEVDGSANGAPVFNQVFSDIQGDYAFSNALPIGGDYTVTPGLDQDPTNGVTTYDLVLINRHILGLEPLSTPYKMIAADANMSNTITTFDIVEIRKLILGIYNELPSNTSWRFVDQTQVFSNPQNPFADVIRENRSFSQIAGSANGDFVGVKIGDVNGTAAPNATAAPDDRTAGTLYFDIEDRNVVAGEEVTVTFKAAQKQLGYQFTMNLNGLVATAIEPGANMSEENFAVFADANAITTSVNGGAGEFAIKFRATQAGQLSQMLGVSSRITKAEAYNESSEKEEVAFRFNRDGVSTVAGVGFELYQNVPNPFVSKTYVGFNLPEATEATLTVYDETGRTIYTTKGQFAKGRNAIALDRSVLAGGVLYYKLETAANSATKKMIQTK